MTAAKHLSLLVPGAAIWALFWLAGLPDYYQQYSQAAMAVFCVLVAIAIGLAAPRILLRGRADGRIRRTTWISFYFTFPFAIYDGLYCFLIMACDST